MNQVKINVDMLFEIIYSHQRLGNAEYVNNPSYNDSHYHYKAEMNIVDFLHKNGLWEQYVMYTKVKQSLV